MPGPEITRRLSTRVYDATRNQNGMWCVPNMGYVFGSVVAGASAYRLARFVPSRNMTIVKIGFATTLAATNNDNIDVGLYDSVGNRLVSSGATAGKANATAGPQTISVTSTQLAAGQVYYAGLAYGAVGGTAATLVTMTPNQNVLTTMFGAGAGALEISSAPAGATLPVSATFSNASSVGYAVAVLES